MRKCKKIALLLSAVILYCCTANYYGRGIESSYPSPSQHASGQEQSRFSPVIADLYSQAGQSRNFFNVLKLIPGASLKHLYYTLSAGSKAAEAMRTGHFAGYVFYATNQITRFQSTDIIFPFHYFW